VTSISGHPAVRPTPIPTDALDQSANAPGHASSRVDITEKPALAAGSGPAFLALLLILALTAASTALLVLGFIAAATGRPGAVLRIVAGSVGLLPAWRSSRCASPRWPTPEIAQAMLQRQQAGAVIAAREQIVEGTVTMVNQALKRLEADDIVTMDEERRAQMVSNLLVVLCSDQRTQPVVNAGSLYA